MNIRYKSISKAFNRKQTTQFFLVNNLKKHVKINEKDNLTVFEPKLSLRVSNGTDAIPVSQTAILNITNKCLKFDLKDSPICLDLAYFQTQNKTKNWVSLSHLSIFLTDEKKSVLKNTSITFQIRGD